MRSLPQDTTPETDLITVAYMLTRDAWRNFDAGAIDGVELDRRLNGITTGLILDLLDASAMEGQDDDRHLIH